jgi:hypothetical protein
LSSRLPSKKLKVKIYKTIILPAILYRSEMRSFTLREEHRLRVFKKRVLRRIFGRKREEVSGYWRRLRNEELRNSYTSQNIIKVIESKRVRLSGHVARMGEMRNIHKISVGKPEGKTSQKI